MLLSLMVEKEIVELGAYSENRFSACPGLTPLRYQSA
jgi:hypothetical protein